MANTTICDLTKDSTPKFKERRRDAHKGDFGRLLLIGGSFGMSGAIAMAGRAAIVAGAGLVKLAVPESVLPMAACHAPELMSVALQETRSGRIAFAAHDRILSLAAEADVVAIGPGLGRSGGLDALVLRLNREIEKPMLIDADALNALAAYDFETMAASFAGTKADTACRILTPHPGEFARLCRGFEATTTEQPTSKNRRASKDGKTQDTAARIDAVCDFLTRLHRCVGRSASGVILVLKGANTLITNGDSVFVNTSGNPGMATGGSGDVLSGMIASLVGQGFTPFDAAKTGVFLHGRAGDLALCESRIPFEAITATTLIDHIGPAIREL